MSEARLIVAPAPFYHSGNTTRSIMLDFKVALLPAAAIGFLRFGANAAAILAISVAAAVATEYLAQKATKRPCTLGDFNVVYMGLLFGLLMPPTAPLWLPVVGVAFAVGIGKHFFGGIGTNPFNPVLLGWLVLSLSWEAETFGWVHPGADTAAAAVNFANTPLEIVHNFNASFALEKYSLVDLFLGTTPGPIGVCAGAVLLGGLYLVVRRRIDWIIPACFIAGVAGFTMLAESMGWGEARRMAPPLFHLLGGTTLLGAFFLATDFSSRPVTCSGKVIFGLGCGIMVMLIRIFGSFADGVPAAILAINLLTPILDRIRPRVFGLTKEVRAHA